MKKMLLLFVVTTFISSIAIAATAQDKGPAEVKMPVSMGTVTFNHAKHQSLAADCTTCHHSGMDEPKCKNCHDAKPEAPKAKEVFHQLCKDCHKKNNGPSKCKECHVK